MNALRVSALVAVLAAGATTSAIAAVRRPRRTIAQVHAALFTPPPGRRSAAGSPRRSATATAFGHAIEQRLGSGLRLVELSPADVAGRIAVAAVVGATVTAFSVSALAAAGALPLGPLWAVVALGVGALAAWMMWSDVQQKIARSRDELRRDVTDLVQLVALGLTTYQSVEEAIRFALGVDRGASPIGRLVRHELVTAPQRGVPLWDALDDLGRTYEVRELSELATSIERQGTQGVSITDTVTTLAASMRAARLDRLEREADRVNANLNGPTIAFVLTMIVFLAYPLATRISEAFGG